MDKKQATAIPVLVGFGLLIGGAVSDLQALMYVGLVTMICGIVLIFVIGSVNAAKGTAGDKTQLAGCAAIGGVMLCVVGLPMAGVAFMAAGRVEIGLPVFALGPLILAVVIIVFQVRAKHSPSAFDTYDRSAPTDSRVKDVDFGDVVLCMEMPHAEPDRRYFVRVDCDGDHITARSSDPLEKGSRVKVVTYANGEVRALAASTSDEYDEDYEDYDEEFDDEYDEDLDEDLDDQEDVAPVDEREPAIEQAPSYSPAARAPTGIKREEKAGAIVEKPTLTPPATKPSAPITRPAAIEATPKKVGAHAVDGSSPPVAEAPSVAEAPPESSEARPGARKASVGYKGIKKK